MVGPAFRRQLCTEHLSTPADKGNKLNHRQSFAQTPCPGRAGVEEPKAEQREARPPPTRSPVGCWGAQPFLPHRKSRFSSVPPFTQSLFVHPRPRLPSPRQKQLCLAKGQLIFWAASGGKDDNGGSGEPATLKCHQAACKTARAGPRGLTASPRRQGRKPGCVRCCDTASPQPQLSLLPGTPCISWQSEKWPHGQPQADGRTRTYKFPIVPSGPDVHLSGRQRGQQKGDRQHWGQATLPPASHNLPPWQTRQRGGHAECFLQRTWGLHRRGRMG